MGTKMSRVISYKDLKVWHEAMQLTTQVYKLSQIFPKDELFSLTNQLRRAAVSVPSNIAEGNARHSTKEYIHHISIAIGSLAELETQLQISLNLNYINEESLNSIFLQTQKVGALLGALIKSLKTRV
jgi:four helix bundle protein